MAPSGLTPEGALSQPGRPEPTGCASPELWVRDITMGAWSPARWEY